MKVSLCRRVGAAVPALQTTVREALVVSATLRLYDTRDKHTIESFVDDVLDLVELQPNKEALVGGWGA